MGLMKKLTSALVASSLVLSLVGSAFAEYTPAAGAEAGARMQKLGLIQGRGNGDLELNSEITRAELVTTIVRAMGKEDDAKLLKGSTIFPDIANHWASGNIAMAVALVEKAGSDPIGMPDGTFAPDAKLTPAQAVAFLMKFVGVKADGTKTWPQNYLDVAVEKNLITADDAKTIATMQNQTATRGLTFYVFDRAFYSYKFADATTFYTKYVDPAGPELNVDAVAATTIDSKVTITGSVKDFTQLFVGSTAVTPAADGKFSAEFALPEIKAEPYTITVTALDLAGNRVEKAMKVARIVGDAKAISAPATLEVVAGATANVAVSVLDEKNQAIAGVEVTGTSDLGTFENGKFVAGEKAGTGTLTLTSGALTKEVAVTVKAGALAKLVLNPATAEIVAGGSQKFTVAGTDAFGNEVAAPTNVTWSASKGIMGVDGTYGATADAAGTVTVTAAVGTVTGTAAVTVFGNAAKVQIAAPAELVANTKSETTVTATVVDANGNPVKNYNGTVTFASSNTLAVKVKTASVTAVNGVATTTLVAGDKSQATVLSASAVGLTGSTVAFTPAKQVVTNIAMSSTGSLAAASGSAGTVTMKLKDQTGNDMLAANVPTSSSTQLKVRLTTSDKSVVYFDSNSSSDIKDVTIDEVTETINIAGTTKVGGATITGAVTAPSGSTVTIGSVAINTLVVGDKYQLKLDELAATEAGKNMTVKVRVLDFNGNQLTTSNGDLAGIAITAENADGDAVTLYGTSTGLSAVKGYVAATLAIREAGTITLTAEGGSLLDATTSVDITPAAAYQIGLKATPSTIQASPTSTSTLKVSISDRYGNQVTDGSYAVTLKKSGTATATFAETVLNTNDGEATVTVTGTANVGTDTFTATATGLNGATAQVTTAVLGSPYKLAFADTDGSASTFGGTAGEDATVKVAVYDAVTSPAANLLTYDNGRAVTLTVKDVDKNVVGTYTGTTENGVAAIKVNLTAVKTDGYFLTATADGLKDATGGALAIAPAKATSVKVTADRPTMSANASSAATLTVSLLDKFGNTVKPSSSTAVKVKVTSGTVASLTGADGDGFLSANISAGASDVKFTNALVATAAAGTVTVTAYSGDLATGAVDVTTVVTGDANALSIATPADTVVTTAYASGKQAVTVKLVDGNGNVLTHVSDKTVYVKSITSGNGLALTYAKAYKTDGTELTVGDANSTVTFSKGQATFWFINKFADSLTYKFGTTTVAGIADKSVTGVFTPAVANKVVVDQTSPLYVNGNGIALTTVKARVTDEFGSTVSTATGTMTFEIKAGSDFATLQTLTAPIVNGEAYVIAQSKLVTSNSWVRVQASTDVDADGTVEDNGLEIVSNSQTFYVDATAPTDGAIAINGYAASATTVTAGALALTATASDTVSGLASVKFEYKNVSASGTWQEIALDETAGDNFTASWTPESSTADQQYTLRITVTDNAGRTAQFTRDITVDNTP